MPFSCTQKMPQKNIKSATKYHFWNRRHKYKVPLETLPLKPFNGTFHVCCCMLQELQWHLGEKDFVAQSLGHNTLGLIWIKKILIKYYFPLRNLCIIKIFSIVTLFYQIGFDITNFVSITLCVYIKFSLLTLQLLFVFR